MKSRQKIYDKEYIYIIKIGKRNGDF